MAARAGRCYCPMLHATLPKYGIVHKRFRNTVLHTNEFKSWYTRLTSSASLAHSLSIQLTGVIPIVTALHVFLCVSGGCPTAWLEVGSPFLLSFKCVATFPAAFCVPCCCIVLIFQWTACGVDVDIPSWGAVWNLFIEFFVYVLWIVVLCDFCELILVICIAIFMPTSV